MRSRMGEDYAEEDANRTIPPVASTSSKLVHDYTTRDKSKEAPKKRGNPPVSCEICRARHMRVRQ